MIDRIDRAELGSLTLVFATHAKRRAAWDQGLKGWNMETSPYLDEIRAVSREEGREQGRKKGLTEGREGATKALLVRQGRQKFGKPPTKQACPFYRGIQSCVPPQFSLACSASLSPPVLPGRMSRNLFCNRGTRTP
jgi:hypothetical protein